MVNHIKRTSKIIGISILVFGFTISAFAGENIIWNGVGDPDNTGTLQADPLFGYQSIFPADYSDNNITINGDVPGLVYGGGELVMGGNVADSVTGNSVVIGGNATIGISGGGQNQGAVLGGVILGVVAPGNVTGSVLDNSVQVAGDAFIYNDVYGGLLYFDPSITGNEISGRVAGNEVTVSGGEIVGAVFGGQAAGYSGTGLATNNRVTVNNGTIGAGATGANTGIVGGYAFNTIGTATAMSNTVTINGGEMTYIVQGGYAKSSSGSATVSENRVIIINGNITANVYGGLADSSGAITCTALNNTVTINGGTITGWVLGGYANNGETSYNHVEITDGILDSSGASIRGGWSVNGESHHNTISVSGGNIQGDIYGGWASNGNATNNTITISGNPILTMSGIYGGESDVGDAFTGNTLNIQGFAGEVGYLKNFENYNFMLKASLTNGDSVLSVTSATEYTDLTNTTITITGVESGAFFKPGDQITLISQTQNVFDTFAGQNVLQGALLVYDFEYVSSVTDALTVQITSGSTQPSAKAYSEGRLASLAFVNQGSDFIANQAISRAVQNTRNEGYVTPFVVIGGGKSRYQSGSHINVEGISALVGLASGLDLNAGHLTLGGFFEAGWGNYNTHNSFNNAPSVKGDGDTEYYGGGLLGRFDFNGSALGSFYSEASARIGSVSNDFSSSDLGLAGQKAKYDSDSLYYGLHVGLGYIFNLTQQIKLDTYGKFFWLHQNSDSVTILGDRLKFDDADSVRARLGGRLSIDLLPGFTPYGGAAYEYEFSGKAKAKAYGYNVLTPEIKGGSGLFEVGGVVQPDLDMGLYFDFAAQGYVGKREGVSGSLTVGLSF